MCGLVGYLDFQSTYSDGVIKEMANSLSHRGPDDYGHTIHKLGDAEIALGHRRLSIVGLDPNGVQPMNFNEISIVYNGEVYNFAEIKRELEKSGYTFQTLTDTEVILKAYHNWGEAAISRFNGMFSIVILDRTKGLLLFMRDRFGVKPLYYHIHSDGIIFGSELKSIVLHPKFKKEIDQSSLRLFLQYGYIPQPLSIYKATNKLEPGTILELDVVGREYKKRRYWDSKNAFNKEKLDLTEEEALEQLERLTRSAVNYRLKADVPVGMFLSGGYDSSLVTALAKAESSQRLQTFTIGFENQRYNEAFHAEKVASHLGTDHSTLYCSNKDFIDLLPLLPQVWDEPFSDNSIIPTLLVSKLASERVKVCLSADGGDELFGGYNKYTQSLKFYQLFGQLPFNRQLAKALLRIDPEKLYLEKLIHKFPQKYYRACQIMLAGNEREAFQNFHQYATDSHIDALMLESHSTGHPMYSDYANSEFETHLDYMLSLDTDSYLCDQILVKVDRATMNYGLEGREPLLDYRLFEFAAQLPDKFKINNNSTKHILKLLTHKYVPKQIMERPKMGFSSPVEEWLMTDLRSQIDLCLEKGFLQKQGLFNHEYLHRIKREFYSGYSRHSGMLWNVLIFQLWYRHWIQDIM